MINFGVGGLSASYLQSPPMFELSELLFSLDSCSCLVVTNPGNWFYGMISEFELGIMNLGNWFDCVISEFEFGIS